MQYKLLAVAVVGGMIALCPFAKADEWDKRTVVTFKQPIEIPGMVLPAGTYVMKLFDSPADRDVVQIFNKTETRIFKTVFAVPTYRAEPTGKTVITFEERTAGSPQAIKDWYYPGDLRGEEFIYHKPHLMLAAQTTTPAPPMQAASKAGPGAGSDAGSGSCFSSALAAGTNGGKHTGPSSSTCSSSIFSTFAGYASDDPSQDRERCTVSGAFGNDLAGSRFGFAQA